MKFAVRTFFAALAVVAMASPSYGDVLANWTFETSIPTTGGPHVAEAGLFAATSFALSNTGGTFSNPVGNGSAESFSSNGWDLLEYFEFSSSTVGFQGVSLGFAQTSSSTGPGEFRVEYRAGGVGAYTSFADYAVLPNQAAPPGLGAWTSVTEITGYNYLFDLSSITALDNSSIVEFRLVMRSTNDATPPGTVASTGTSRVDNVFINATAIPEPTTAGLGLLGLVGLVGLVRRRVC